MCGLGSFGRLVSVSMRGKNLFGKSIGKKLFGKLIEIYKINKTVKKYQYIFQECGSGNFVRFVGARVVVATWLKLALRICL